MSSKKGAATQICSHQFDRRFLKLAPNVQAAIQEHIDRLGMNLERVTHFRMQGVDAFRLRIGDYRLIYQFEASKNELYLITIGHRRDIYKQELN